MPAEEARTCHDEVSRYGKFRTQPVPAAQTSDERADKQERRSVRAKRMDRADPSFSA